MRLADIEYRTTDHSIVARVKGEIDMSNSNEIVAGVSRATPNEALGVVLDLTEVEYLDSSGIHLIYRLRTALGTRGQRLALVIGDASPVQDALRLAGVSDLVELHSTVDQALAALDPAEQDATATAD